jgi:hypothetical protein
VRENRSPLKLSHPISEYRSEFHCLAERGHRQPLARHCLYSTLTGFGPAGVKSLFQRFIEVTARPLLEGALQAVSQSARGANGFGTQDRGIDARISPNGHCC